jgi:hypothetical protein
MTELKVAQKIDNGRSARVTVVPALPYSILISLTRYFFGTSLI